MGAWASSHKSGDRTQCNEVEHLDAQSWRRVQILKAHVQPCDWIKVLKCAAHSCMFMFFRVQENTPLPELSPARSLNYSLINHRAVTISYLTLLSVNSVSADGDHSCAVCDEGAVKSGV